LEEFLDRVRDISRFIQYYRTAIENSILQVYYLSLIFSLLKSLIKISFQDKRPDWILNNSVEKKHWSLCLQIFERYSDTVESIIWSSDRNRIVSVFYNKTARIWDPAIGKTISILKKYNSPVQLIVWLPDRNRIVSVFYNKTARIWDPATGKTISILKRYSYSIESIVWLPDRN